MFVCFFTKVDNRNILILLFLIAFDTNFIMRHMVEKRIVCRMQEKYARVLFYTFLHFFLMSKTEKNTYLVHTPGFVHEKKSVRFHSHFFLVLSTLMKIKNPASPTIIDKAIRTIENTDVLPVLAMTLCKYKFSSYFPQVTGFLFFLVVRSLDFQHLTFMFPLGKLYVWHLCFRQVYVWHLCFR